MLNNNGISTRENQNSLVAELLRNRVSTLEEELVEKNAIIDFFLHEKVKSKPKDASITGDICEG